MWVRLTRRWNYLRKSLVNFASELGLVGKVLIVDFYNNLLKIMRLGV